MTPTFSGNPRVLVMGCGGIGGILASGLVSHGVDTTLVTHNPAIADAIGRRGLTVRDGQTTRTMPARAYAALPNDAGTFDFVFLATQPPQVVAAARMAAPHLRDGGAMVCFQNGVCEPYVEETVGAEQVLGAIVVWAPQPAAHRDDPAGVRTGARRRAQHASGI